MRLTLSAFALLAIGLSFLPVVVLRATTPIQTKTNTHAGPSTTNAITFDSTPTIGNTIVCSFHSNGTTTLTNVTGGVSSWTPRFTHTATNQKTYVRDGTADGSTTITMTMSSNASTPSLICAELDGAYTYDSQATVATGTTSPVQTNAVTTSAVNTFLFAVITKSSGSTTGAPQESFNAISYSASEDNGRYVGAYRNATSAAAYTTSWTTNATLWATTIIAYAEPSGGGGGGGAVTKGLTLLGVGNE
jgi:hypothetical protein